MVSPKDFFRITYENELDREILHLFFTMPNHWLSASEITRMMRKPESAERNVRYRLKKLVKRMDVIKELREATGNRGRAPEIYTLSETVRGNVYDFLNKKEMELRYVQRALIVKNEYSMS